MIDFDVMFRALHGDDPFPWQSRLADHLVAGTTPDLHIPTGLGKTAGVSTAWLWALASDVERNGPSGRSTPIRLVHVAPRRVIIDDTYLSNRKIADALRDATSGPLLEVAEILRSLSKLPGHPGDPLAVANLRGGCIPDLDWRERADIPTIISSTTEQAISGLLFRSYLSSSSTKPMVAGLLGVDAGWVMDESHLMEPSVAAVEWCLNRQKELASTNIPRRSWIIRSSATRSSAGETTVTLGPDDIKNDLVARRIGSDKTIVCVEAKPTAKQLADYAVKFIQDGAKKVIVVCKPVALAVETHTKLLGLTRGRKLAGVDVELLHGQQRQAERNEIMGRVQGVMKTGAEPRDKPLILVSTSVVEVGADLDADAMVCEQAAWPNLQQRLGRLGRNGTPATCVLIGQPPKEKKKEDPQSQSDEGVDETDELDGGEEPEDETPESGGNTKKKKKEAKVVPPDPAQVTFAALVAAGGKEGFVWRTSNTPPDGVASDPIPEPWPLVDETITLLSFTGPLGAVTVDPEQVMAGVACPDDREVSLAWRDHLSPGLTDKQVKEHLDAHPLRPHETVTIPLYQATKGLGNLEPGALESIRVRRPTGETRRYDGKTLRDGDQLLLPVTSGCYGHWGVNWGSSDQVTDVSDVPPVAGNRNTPRAHFQLTEHQQESLFESLEETELAEAILGVLTDEQAASLDWVDWEKAKTRVIGKWVFVSGGWDQSSDESASCSRPAKVSLTDHQHDVADLADRMARELGATPGTVSSLVTAAAHHDEGKRDSRIQRAYENRGATVLAKSVVPRDRYRRAIEEAAISGWRHEAASDRLVSHSGDPLAAHLAGATHGWSRPGYRLIPAMDTALEVACPNCLPGGDTWQHNPDTDGHTHSRMGGSPARFVELNRRYGPWGLAWMETLVRQADWMASSAPRLGVSVPEHRPIPARQPDATVSQRKCAEPPFDWSWSVTGLLGSYGTLLVYSDTHPEATLHFDGRKPVLTGPLCTDELKKLVDLYRKRLTDEIINCETVLFHEGFVAIEKYRPVDSSQLSPLHRLMLSQMEVPGNNIGLNRLAFPMSPRENSRTLKSQLSVKNHEYTPWGWDAEAENRSPRDRPVEPWHWLCFLGALLVPYRSQAVLATWTDQRTLDAVIPTLSNPTQTATPVPLESYKRYANDRSDYRGWVIAR